MKNITTPIQTEDTHESSRNSHKGWLVLGAGLAAWWLTRKHRSMLVRRVGMLTGTALISRAAGGKDGIATTVKQLPTLGKVRPEK